MQFLQKNSTQRALITMIEKARIILDKVGTFAALLTDLSKAFDCMTCNLLLVKFHTLNFGMNEFNLIFDYLTGRKQRVEISPSFSSHLDLFQGISQGSILDCCYSIFFSVIYSYLLRKQIS